MPGRHVDHPAFSSVVAGGVVGALAVVWLILAPRTADLAAQVYRAGLFARSGFVLWDNNWFAGHYIPGYSLLFPALAAAIGPRTVGVAAAFASAVLFADVVRRAPAARRNLAVTWFAVGVSGDLFIGRLTFSLGTACAVACVAALSRRRPAPALGLGLLTAAVSPVSAVLLGVVLLAWSPTFPRRWRWPVVAAPVLGAATMALAFPDGGVQPYPPAAAAVGVFVVMAVGLLTAREHVALRNAAVLYAVAIVAACVVPSPMGSNVTRLGVLLAGPVLVLGAPSGRSRSAVAAAALSIVAWQTWGPLTEVVKARTTPATSAAYFQPLLAQLHKLAPGRIEVVPTSTRWESVFVAPDHLLARGWETQLDRRYDALFYAPQLQADSYRRWLQHLGVAYVALSDAPTERWGRTERRLLQRSPPFLEEVWRSSHWRLFAVRSPTRLVSSGELLRLGSQAFTLREHRAGTVVVRIRYTPFWHAGAGACVEPGPQGFTRVRVPRAGVYPVRATWQRPEIPNGNNSCPR